MDPDFDDGTEPTTVHLRRAVDGDRESVDWLIKRLSPLLRAQAGYRLGSVMVRHIEPEDVVADAWMVALKRLPEITPRESRLTPVLLKFLATTVRYVVNNRMRAALRRNQDLSDKGESHMGGVEDPMTGIVTRAMKGEDGDIVYGAIMALDDDARQLVVLRAIEGWSNVEIGSMLGEEPNTISHRYQRVLSRLRSTLAGSVLEEIDDN